MATNSGFDIQGAIDTRLLTKLFGSVKYPLTIHVPRLREGLEEEVALEVTSVDENASKPGDELLGELVLSNALDAYIATRQKVSLQANADSIEMALNDLFQDFARTENPEVNLRKSVLSGIAKDQEKFIRNFDAFLQRGPSVDIRWVEVRLLKQPVAKLGNPLSFSKLEFEVRAKIEACIKVFGKRFCAPATTPWVNFNAANASIAFEADKLKVLARPRVKDLNLEIKIKIWKWTYTIRIGVTTHVNRMLESVSPTVLDLTGKVFPVPIVNRTYVPASVEAPAHGQVTAIEVSGEFR